MIRSRKVLDTARGAECSIRLPGICQGGTETTIWAHLNYGWAGKGMGQKAHDILGFHACFSCHTAYDQHLHTLSDAELTEYLFRAVCETLVKIVQSGVVFVPVDRKQLSSEKPIKPRKPKDQRVKIQRPAKTQWPKRGFGK